MTAPTYAQNKEHIYKWREHNREKYREIAAKSERWRRIKKEFLLILII